MPPPAQAFVARPAAGALRPQTSAALRPQSDAASLGRAPSWAAAVQALLDERGLGHTRALERIQRLWALFRGRRLPARQYVSELCSVLGGAKAAAPIIEDMLGQLTDHELQSGLASAFDELQAFSKEHKLRTIDDQLARIPKSKVYDSRRALVNYLANLNLVCMIDSWRTSMTAGSSHLDVAAGSEGGDAGVDAARAAGGAAAAALEQQARRAWRVSLPADRSQGGASAPGGCGAGLAASRKLLAGALGFGTPPPHQLLTARVAPGCTEAAGSGPTQRLSSNDAQKSKVRGYFLVFVPTIREIRDFYREMQRTNRESITMYSSAGDLLSDWTNGDRTRCAIVEGTTVHKNILAKVNRAVESAVPRVSRPPCSIGLAGGAAARVRFWQCKNQHG
eukprot:SAG31_NODE_1535_length_7971_cov_7.118438_7_plen_393_part_00